jgi:hypothetical protein
MRKLTDGRYVEHRLKYKKVTKKELGIKKRQTNYMMYCVRFEVAATCSCCFLALEFFYPEDVGDTFLRNVGSHKTYTAPHPRRRHSLYDVLFEAIVEAEVTKVFSGYQKFYWLKFGDVSGTISAPITRIFRDIR